MDPLKGLTTAEAIERLERCGPNDPVPVRRWSIFRTLWDLVANPLTLILLLAAATSLALGEGTDALILIAIVLASSALNFAQSYRSENAARKLRDQVAVTASVLRDGAWSEIRRSEIVPDDIVQISAGDLVPADGTLLESTHLFVQEAALTGESIPADKEVGQQVSLGTSVASGSGIFRVVETGPRTTFGGIAARLSAHPPETAFEHDLRKFSVFILRAILFLVLLLLLASMAAHRDPLQSLLFAVALAVGLTPEFLPVVVSVTLTNGAVKMASAGVIVKRLAAIQNLGSIDVLCSDKTGTLTKGVLSVETSVDSEGRPSQRPLELAALNSRFETGIRSPLDAAILERVAPAEGWAKFDEIPFDFERRRLSVAVSRGEERLLITKGAPDGIVSICATVDRNAEVRGIEIEAARRAYEGLEKSGFRVLAVAYKPLGSTAPVDVSTESEMTLAGFLAISDPPIDGVNDSIRALREDGVVIKLISGDSELVARHLAAQVGIDAEDSLLGAEIEDMTDQALAHHAERVSVFARVSPAQKTRILLALRQRGHTVGFLGDGINDAPSIRAADVGISVAGAVEVAREAADIILTRPGVQVLHRGILEGRRAFGNVMKYLFMGTSSNFGNMLSMAAASFFLPFLPMLPTQILLNNFLYDMSQISIPSDNVDETWLKKPRRWDFGLIRDFMVYVGPISSLYDFLTFYVLLRLFHATQEEFHTGWFVESIATQTLVLFVIRTFGNPLRSRPSLPLSATVIGVVVLSIALPYLPVGATFGFTPLPVSFLMYVLGATVTYLLLVEVSKRIVLRRGSGIAL